MSPKIFGLSLYLTLGFLVSQFTHIYVYSSRGAPTLETWYHVLGITDRQPSIAIATIMCFILAILIFGTSYLFLARAEILTGERMLTIGLTGSLVFCVASQLIFSSVMRLSYEFSFCLILLSSTIILNVFFPLDARMQNQETYRDLWDILKILIPFTLAFPILLGGAGLISSFYQEEPEFLRTQLYRHVAMAIYFEIGSVLFLLLPVLRRILIIKTG